MDVAGRLGITVTYVSDIERGKRMPPRDTDLVRRWAELVEPDYPRAVEHWLRLAEGGRSIRVNQGEYEELRAIEAMVRAMLADDCTSIRPSHSVDLLMATRRLDWIREEAA